jgi:diketogulonate reductase-like aldo/keto reductase
VLNELSFCHSGKHVQAEAHPYFRNDALVEWCASEGIHFTAYAPLGSPDSASMLSRRSAGPELMTHPTVVEVARRTGHDVGQVLLRWALQRRPGCSVLPKSVTPSRITSNLTGVRASVLPGRLYQRRRSPLSHGIS